MQVKLYIPSYEATIVDKVATQLSNLFGGCTIIPNCKGYWKNPKTEQHEVDNITIIESYTKIDLNDIENIKTLLFYSSLYAIKDELKQKSLAYSIDNTMFFL